ncbi:MAG: prepilin-type N-terminal cleavage/methylation domain-containing protein [Verrucomicrobia bacterium]|nr:prepilin-type N-terminal cleavage/methylation domain-containing protein [Verrucomicrobiota bacterium]
MSHLGAKKRKNQGFTLVEISIAVAIIGLLAVMSIPAFQKARLKSQITKIANDFRVFGDAFNLYALQTGSYPVDTHLVLPPGMEEYIKPTQWSVEIWGGNYNWEGPSWGEGGPYTYAGIALDGSSATVDWLTQLDAEIDDGDLSTGSFRETPNGRYTYIIEE